MSGSPRAGAKPEKTMSSRLLTMKFMQRAAASTAAKEAQAPASDDNPPTPKRQRLSSEPGSPATPRTSDLEAISAALAAEEEKRREAIARQAAEAGETQWVLDIPAVTNQAAPRSLAVAADSLDADDEANVGGRRSYGNFKRKQRVTQNQSDEKGDAQIMNPAGPAQVEAMINKTKSETEAKGAKKEKVKLSRLTSISGSRQAAAGGTPPQKKKKRKSR